MARVLQTLTIVAVTGQGTRRPPADAHLWAAFNVRAHHMQAQTVALRMDEASELWKELDELIRTDRLPERMTGLLYEAALGYRVRRPATERESGVTAEFGVPRGLSITIDRTNDLLKLG